MLSDPFNHFHKYASFGRDKKLTFYQQSVNDYPVSSCFSQKIILGITNPHVCKKTTIRSFTNKQMILKKML
jgi:hypothetical protein